jgi:hypothetical protein
MRNVASLACAAMGIAALALAPRAAADTVRAVSAPNGDVWISSSSGSTTNKDKDGDFNTVTQADRLGLHWSVSSTTAFAQTIGITAVLDGPGSAQDMTLVDEDRAFGPWTPEQGGTIEQDFTELQVKRSDWPAGTYALTVTATGSETVSATSTFTIAY